MKIIFFGSSDFAVPVLYALSDKEDVLLAVTQPDRKKGRSLKLTPTAVQEASDRRGIRTFQPADVNSDGSIEYLKGFGAELFVVVSFGQILRKKLLDIPELYALNLHASLLPKYRGAAPINWAIANGDKATGVTVIRMNEKMDAGEVILKEAVSIDTDEDAIAVSDKLSAIGAVVLLNAIGLIRKGKVEFRKQNDDEATYVPKLKKEDGLINWHMGSGEICNRVRAFVPWPVCFTYWNGKVIKIWKARPADMDSVKDVEHGTVVGLSRRGISVNTGEGLLRIEELQLEGRRRMKAEEFVAGHRNMKTDVRFMLHR